MNDAVILRVPCTVCEDLHPATHVVTQLAARIDLLVCNEVADEYRKRDGYTVKPMEGTT